MIPECTIGPPVAEEYALVYDAWISSFRKSPWAGCVRNDKWDETQRATITGLLDRGARILVALAPTVEGIHTGRRVMGYTVSEPGVLHWIYVKRDYRGHGIARVLLNRTILGWPPGDWVYTHRTGASSFLPSSFHWDATPARVAQARAR